MTAGDAPVLVGYDNSPAAKAALRWAADEAELTGAPLILLYVASSVAEWEMAAIQVDPDPVRHRIEKMLANDWSEALRARGLRVRTQVAVGRPAVEIMRLAREENARLVVIGMTGRGTLSELVSDHTQRVLRHHAVRPVVAVPAVWADDDA